MKFKELGFRDVAAAVVVFLGLALLFFWYVGGLEVPTQAALADLEHSQDPSGILKEEQANALREAAIKSPIEPQITRKAESKSLVATVSPAASESNNNDTGYQQWKFEGVLDSQLTNPIHRGKVIRVHFNKGGSSVSLRLDFDNGARAAFKPDQTNLQSVPRYEIAAYRIDRILGLGGVAPAIPAVFNYADLESVVDAESKGIFRRRSKEIIKTGDKVFGELSWWIPKIYLARINRHLIDSTDGIVTWRRYLKATAKTPKRHQNMLRQISNVTVFDFVIGNIDRWSGGNTRASKKKGKEGSRTLYFMDNTMSFGNMKNGAYKSRRYLNRVQKFSRSLIGNLRSLDATTLRTELRRDLGPYDELIDEKQLEAVLARRDFALKYIDDLIKNHGEKAVLRFP